MLRAGGDWQIRHRGELVAEHAVLPGRHALSVMPEHGPGAATRNARTRYADTVRLLGPAAEAAERFSVVEQRDLAVYEQMLEVA